MDERVFIIIALVITLGLIAGLYFVIDLLSQRVLTFAGDARGREQREIVNNQRLVRTVNELVDEMAVLTEALKTERILRSHGEATARVPAKKTARDDCATMPMPPPPEAGKDDSTRVHERAEMPDPAGVPPPQPC